MIFDLKTKAICATAVMLAAITMSGTAFARGKACPLPGGVQCASLPEVYARTNSQDSLSPDRESPMVMAPVQKEAAVGEQQQSTSREQVAPSRIAYRPMKHADVVANGDTLEVSMPEPRVQQIPVSTANSVVVTNTEPVRAPAKVMRILVMGWEDESGSLHMPGTIFTEVAPKRWSVGEPIVSGAEGYTLLEGLGSTAAKDSQATASGASAPAALPGK